MCNPTIGVMAAPRTILLQIGARPNEVSPCDVFRHGADWPISALALAALVDLGLSDERIARYFHVGLGNVQSLRLRFGLQPAHV